MNRTGAGSRSLAMALPVLIVAGVLVLAVLVGRPSLIPVNLPFPMLVVGGVGLLILLQRPGLGLVAMAALSFTVPFTFGTGSDVRLSLPVFLVVPVGLAWLVDGLRSRSLRLPRSRAVWPLLLFVASGLVSLLAGRAYWDPLVPQPDNLTLVQLGQWGLYVLSAVMFLLAADLGRRERWLRVAVWTFLALASEVVLEFYLRPLRGLLGWSGMANRSLFWVWLGALASGQLLFNRRLRAWTRGWLLALLAGAACVVWVMQATWTSGWAPFTVSVLAVACLWVWRRKRVLALAIAFGLLVLAVGLYPTLFLYSGGEQEFDAAWGGRMALYRVVLDLARQHPILGLGPAAYRHYAFGRWLSLGVGRALYIRPAVSSHNNYIDIYAQQGLVGLALFLWFLFELGRLGWRLARRFRGDFQDGYVQGALGGLAATMAAMMLADWLLPFVYNIGFLGFRTSVLAWMFLGGLVALEQGSGESGSGQESET